MPAPSEVLIDSGNEFGHISDANESLGIEPIAVYDSESLGTATEDSLRTPLSDQVEFFYPTRRPYVGHNIPGRTR